MRLSPLKELLLGALLWLPLSFFLWFWLASPIVFPVTWLTDQALTGFFPDLVREIKQFGYIIEVTTRIGADVPAAQRAAGVPVVALEVNPMIYAYGLPLLAGLVMATPLSAGRRFAQIGIGYLVLVPVQAWGVSWEILKIMALELGPRGAGAVAETGLDPNVIGLCYQFGYLILPAVTPVVIWILANRAFLEALTRQPGAGEAGAE